MMIQIGCRNSYLRSTFIKNNLDIDDFSKLLKKRQNIY